IDGVRKDLDAHQAKASELRAEKGRLAPLAAKAEPLARADARIAELEPQLAKARDEAATLRDKADEHHTQAGIHQGCADELQNAIAKRRRERDDIRDERAHVSRIADRASALEQARAIVAELEPRLTETRAEAERLRSQADEVAPQGE